MSLWKSFKGWVGVSSTADIKDYVDSRKYSTDLYMALTALSEVDHLILVVKHGEYIPYVHRGIFRSMGQPSRIVSGVLWYARDSIRVVTADDVPPEEEMPNKSVVFNIRTF